MPLGLPGAVRSRSSAHKPAGALGGYCSACATMAVDKCDGQQAPPPGLPKGDASDTSCPSTATTARTTPLGDAATRSPGAEDRACSPSGGASSCSSWEVRGPHSDAALSSDASRAEDLDSQAPASSSQATASSFGRASPPLPIASAGAAAGSELEVAPRARRGDSTGVAGRWSASAQLLNDSGDHCWLCGAENPQSRCSKCKQARYCSGRCQMKHWHLGHKATCSMPQASGGKPMPAPPAGLFPDSVERPVISEAEWQQVPLRPIAAGRDAPPRGLRNFGNSCYVNAVLQCLYHGAPLVPGLLSDHRAKCCQSEEGESCFRCDLEEVFSSGLCHLVPARGVSSFERGQRVLLRGLARMEMNGLQGVVTHPNAPGAPDRCGIEFPDGSAKAILKKRLLRVEPLPAGRRASDAREVLRWLPRLNDNFMFGSQEDAHEFLRSLLRMMEHEEVQEHIRRLRAQGNEEQLPTNTDLTATPARLFGGLLASRCSCPKCEASTYSFERFMDLSLEITDYTDTIEEALRLFTAPERLDKENLFECGECKFKVRVQKQMTMYEAPGCLVLHLKRFRYDSMGASLGRINKRVDYGPTLALNPFFCTGAPGLQDLDIYDLRAVAVHIDLMEAADNVDLDMRSFGEFGHYVAFVCSPREGGGDEWYRLDDSRVARVSKEDAFDQNGAYLLFYTRRHNGTSAPSSRAPSKDAAARHAEAAASNGTSASLQSAPPLEEGASKKDVVSAQKCHGIEADSVCQYFASHEGLCSQCYVKKHGAPPPSSDKSSDLSSSQRLRGGWLR